MSKNATVKIIQGDAANILKELPSESVNLVLTSPPYADQRNHTYGGIKPDNYVRWFSPIAKEILRITKPDGTFILNIKESVVEGERHTYVLDLIQELRAQGWLWTEEYVWHKKNSHPGKWPNRFRDGWERLLQFNKQKKFCMYQDDVMVPVGEWHAKRFKSLSPADKKRTNSKVNSGFGRNVSNWAQREMVYPDNVLHFATESSNKKHSAVFPEKIPEWFIKLFSKKNDWILDPFTGSGTTNVVAQRLNRNSIGIEILPEYVQLARDRVALENNKKTPWQSYTG